MLRRAMRMTKEPAPPFLSWCPEGKETLRYEVPGEGMV